MLYYGDLDDGHVLHNMFVEAGGKISGCYCNFQREKRGLGQCAQRRDSTTQM
jgi:hypothetical protein